MMDIFFTKARPVSETRYKEEECKRGSKDESCGAKKGFKDESCKTKKESCNTRKNNENTFSINTKQFSTDNGIGSSIDYDDMNEGKIADIKKSIEKKKKKIAAKFKARKDTKKALVSESIMHIFESSLGFQMQTGDSYISMKRNLVESFVEEKGYDKLLEDMKFTSIPLANIAFLCEEYIDKIFEEVEDDETEYIINSKEKDKFYDKLKSIDIDDISDLVRVRVLSDIEDFTQSNRNMKNELSENIKNTQAKIDDDTSEGVKEAMTLQAKRANTLLMDKKIKNVFEAMVEKIAKSVISNENMSSYLEEGGRLDMVKIVENAKVMYTFMEVLNTAKLEKIDESYVKDVLKSL